MSKIAMTGATGAIGSAVRDELIRRGHSVISVGRNADLRWDLADPLPQDVAEAFASVDSVVHAAADIRLQEPYENISRVNVDSVREIVSVVSRSAKPAHLVYISSAFAQPGPNGQHENGYEESKFAAEQVLINCGTPFSILCPSLVIGNQWDGRIQRYSGIYIFLRMLRLGLVPAIPGFGSVGVDIVPVDIVATVAASEIEAPSGRQKILITSGDAAPHLEDLVTSACDIFDALGDQRLERPKFVKPEVYHRLFRPLVEAQLSPAQLVMLKTVEIFLPYFERDHVFPSDLALNQEELLDAWKKSVECWFSDVSTSGPRGRVVWANKR